MGIGLAFSLGLMYFIFEFLAHDTQILLPTAFEEVKAQQAKGGADNRRYVREAGQGALLSAFCPFTD